MRLSRSIPLVLLIAAFSIGGCEERAPVPPPPAANPEASDIVERAPATVATRDSGEVLMLDVPHLLQASAEQGDEVYGIMRDNTTQPWFTLDGGPVDEQAVEAWLGRFTPLEAEGRYPDLTADQVQSDVTHRLVFRFDDGSGRALALEERPDGLAAVSQDDGPVFRLPAAQLDALVPPRSYFHAE
jgi:hypothetical protein